MEQIKIAFIKAGWHKDIVNNALAGFISEFNEQGADSVLKTYDAWPKPVVLMPLSVPRWSWMAGFTVTILLRRQWLTA